MKRLIALLIALVFLFTGCKSYRADITREEIIAAYEAAGYQVYTGIYEEKTEQGVVAYVRADHPNGNYIYFSFFEYEEAAKAYEKDMDHPAMTYIMSFIFGEPSLLRLDAYGCVVVSYDDPDLFKPFEDLLTKAD